MTLIPKVSHGEIGRVVLSAIFPWLPPVLFEKIDFMFHLTGNSNWYYSLSGNRLPVDIASFALWGIVAAFLLRPRLAIIQIGLNAVVVWALFYLACPTYGPGGLWQPECYNAGPDGLVGVRLAGILFFYGVLPVIVKAAPQGEALSRKIRPVIAILSGIILTMVMIWYPIASWFSGVTYLAPLVFVQALLLIGMPQIATGILAARIGGSIRVGAASGIASLLFLSAYYWTLNCPGCDRSILFLSLPFWALFALLGSITELGASSRSRLPKFSGWLGKIGIKDLRRVGLALVITLCVLTAVINDFWNPSVLYATSMSPAPGQLVLGQPYYPYVGGYFNSIQYRICCVEIGINISMINPRLLAPDNFLMAGMGIQSPNCCIDGWDFGWRADVFLLSNNRLIVSGSSWETCDGSANCGGYIWEHLWYHTQVTINPQNVSMPIYLRMSWVPQTVNGLPREAVHWYYNTSRTAWKEYGSYLPDRRLGTYFDIGLSGGPVMTVPQGTTLLSQFGVASKTPVSGWHVLFIDPSFQYQGNWRIWDHASMIQGNFSFWKFRYRWGGMPYAGVTTKTNLTDPTIPRDTVEFSSNGGSATLRDFAPLW